MGLSVLDFPLIMEAPNVCLFLSSSFSLSSYSQITLSLFPSHCDTQSSALEHTRRPRVLNQPLLPRPPAPPSPLLAQDPLGLLEPLVQVSLNHPSSITCLSFCCLNQSLSRALVSSLIVHLSHSLCLSFPPH